MTKEKRAGAESKRNTKPLLEVEVYDPVKVSFTIKRESEITLKFYTQFRNEINEVSGLKKITEESIVDALIKTLNDEHRFSSWKLDKESKRTNEENEIANT